jgi:hypothetical protein
VNQSESDEQADCPNCQQNYQRHRTEETEQFLAATIVTNSAHEFRPRLPREEVKEASDAHSTRDSSRQDDRFKRFPQDDYDKKKSANAD